MSASAPVFSGQNQPADKNPPQGAETGEEEGGQLLGSGGAGGGKAGSQIFRESPLKHGKVGSFLVLVVLEEP